MRSDHITEAQPDQFKELHMVKKNKKDGSWYPLHQKDGISFLQKDGISFLKKKSVGTHNLSN